MTTEKIRVLLLAGIWIPVVYFGLLIAGPLLYPGYSHVTQYASELGSASARYPAVFNTAIMLNGVAGILASFGFFYAIRRLGGNARLAALTGLTLLLFGIAAFMGGMFPMPDERHGGYGLGFAFQLTPLLLALALWRRKSLRGLCIFLLAIFVMMSFFIAVMMGVGGLVTRANVGLWQRGNALAGFPWLGIAAWRLRRELLLR
ncbi:MAG: hypothetical protein QOH06_5287 [Acidobacteriota bacterium]|jgi:hypothetical membrane protein|nr:hypothetical protein [Acidobacteriota bacterium]